MKSIEDQYEVEDIDNLSKMVISIFEHWGLPAGDQLELLGMSSTNQGVLNGFRKGESMSGSRDQLDRLAMLLRIHKNLRLLFPRNRELAYKWMTTSSRAFEGRTPVEITVTRGIEGLIMVGAYLEGKRGI